MTTVHRGGVPTAEWTRPDGVRMARVEIDGQEEDCFLAEDLPQFICSLPLEEIDDRAKREAIAAYRARASALAPAVAYREAIALIESFGGKVPEEFRTLKPRPVK